MRVRLLHLIFQLQNDVHDQSNDSTDMFDTLILTCASTMSRDEMKPKADGRVSIGIH